MSYSDDLRKRAREVFEVSNALLLETELIKQDGDGKFDAKNLVMAIVGLTEAKMMNALATHFEYLSKAIGQDSSLSRREELLKKNDEIRRAAAVGDWEKFNDLVEGFGDIAGQDGP